MDTEHFFAPCPRGLESVLAEELRKFGGHAIAVTQGGVGFTGPFELCYRANLESRIASRILWQIHRGPYRHEQDLYDAAHALAWPTWFTPDRTIKVKVSAHHCPLKSLDFVTLRVKDAVCDKFISLGRSRPTVDTQRPDIRIDAFLDQHSVTLYLDTSGEPLFKRGLRHARSDAPLRENLAAGLLALSGWTPDQPLLDPLCGGGTILLEAALIARRIAPGLGRRFAFERFAHFSADRWRSLCEASRAGQNPSRLDHLYGNDRDAAALRAARANFEAAGLGRDITLTQADVLDLAPPADRGLLLTNPPYGVRVGDADRLAEFYPRFGDVLKQRFAGWTAYLFTADQRLPKLIGLAPSRKTPLFNGALECRLYEFKLVSGSMRRDKPPPSGPAQAAT